MTKTLYEILRVEPEIPQNEIKAAYHSRLLETHPDKLKVSDAEVSHKIDEIRKAYAVLGEIELRKKYDEDLKTLFKKQGFNITGDGLDTYTLSEFSCVESLQTGEYTWFKDCPRCTSPNAMELRESDLERGSPDGSGGLQIVVPCQTCSLWITVVYEEELDDE